MVVRHSHTHTYRCWHTTSLRWHNTCSFGSLVAYAMQYSIHLLVTNSHRIYIFINPISKQCMYTGWFSITRKYFLSIYRSSKPTNEIFLFFENVKKKLPPVFVPSYAPTHSHLVRYRCSVGKTLTSTRRSRRKKIKKDQWRRLK